MPKKRRQSHPPTESNPHKKTKISGSNSNLNFFSPKKILTTVKQEPPPDYDPLKAINETEEKQELEETGSFRILDTLAWFLETNTSDCVALTLVKDKKGNFRLILATNKIHAGTNPENSDIKNINETLTEISDLLANNFNKEKEKKLLLNIYNNKLKGAYQGSIHTRISTKNKKLIENLIEIAYDDKKENEPPKIPYEAQENFSESRIQASAAITLANRVLRRFYRFKDNINKETKLEKAISGIKHKKNYQLHLLKYNKTNHAKFEDANWLTEKSEEKGYGIVATHQQTINTITHAEGKLIDFLIKARILTSNTKQNYNFGVSKRLCRYCKKLVISTEQSAKIKIDATKPHEVDIKSWREPLFLKNNSKSTNSYEQEGIGYISTKCKKKYEAIPFTSIKDCKKKVKKINEESNKEIVGIYLNPDLKLIAKVKQRFQEECQNLANEENSFDNDCMSLSSPEKKALTYRPTLSQKPLADTIVDDLVNQRLIEPSQLFYLKTTIQKSIENYHNQSSNPYTLYSHQKTQLKFLDTEQMSEYHDECSSAGT